jgi:hypothetical protein
MTANANVVDLVKGKSTLVRPRYSPGLLLRDDDLKVGVDYTRELSRLLFRSLFGCGVVCGLEVSAELQCGKLVVTVRSGVALSGIGDPIYVPEDTNVIVDPTCGKDIPPKLWVILCRTDKCCAPRSTVCGCEEEDSPSVCTREQETFEIRLVKVEPDDCACMCPEQPIPQASGTSDGPPNAAPSECWCADPCACLKNHYAGECDCQCCDVDCVVLAVLTDMSRDPANPNAAGGTGAGTTTNPWVPNHSVRRFVRPVLMRDPVVFKEQNPGVDPCAPVANPPPVVLQDKRAASTGAPAKPVFRARGAKAQPAKASAAATAAPAKTVTAKAKPTAGKQ